MIAPSWFAFEVPAIAVGVDRTRSGSTTTAMGRRPSPCSEPEERERIRYTIALMSAWA
ncbi:MAG: hypothetical protein R3F61_25120 [Myxococcota bacterium]